MNSETLPYHWDDRSRLYSDYRYLEGVYEKALVIAMREKGLHVCVQAPLRVTFRGQPVGEFFADLLVEDRVLVELKAVEALARVHQAQVINYLKATGLSVGLLVNFGTPKMQFKRLFFNRGEQDVQDAQDEIPA